MAGRFLPPLSLVKIIMVPLHNQSRFSISSPKEKDVSELQEEGGWTVHDGLWGHETFSPFMTVDAFRTGEVQDPHRSFLLRTAPQVKGCLKRGGGVCGVVMVVRTEGRGGGQGVRFCSAEKGGLFLAELPGCVSAERCGMGAEKRDAERPACSPATGSGAAAGGTPNHCGNTVREDSAAGSHSPEGRR
ncbi:hypothetical protein AMECASPLE_037744 [Ameca splendens]|uniref:Uncharacterized protein n=1 Tax=Ameca splendens TaxID=208324 RepID=A0ABV0YJH6_9TELE